MLTRRIRLPQSTAVWQCRCHKKPSAVRHYSRRNGKDSSSSPPSSSSPSTSPSSSSSSSSSSNKSQPSKHSASPPQPPPPSSSSASLYDKLFPSKPSSVTAAKHPRASLPSAGTGQSLKSGNEDVSHTPESGPGAGTDDGQEVDVSHVGDELRAWLEGAGAAAATSVARGRRAQDTAGLRSEKTVLVLSSLSRSLAESDFYRWVPQGRHVAGWAGAISKVVQSVSATTREPRGQYFLFFDTRSAAEACAAQLNRVYELTKAADLSHQSITGGGESLRNEALPRPPPPPPPPPLELRSRPRLMPAAALLRLIVRISPPQQRQQQQQQQQQNLPTPQRILIPYGLATHLSTHLNSTSNNSNSDISDHDDPAASSSSNGSSNSSKWSVLVRLAGSKVTVEAMARAIAADGEARNLPWRLIEPRSPSPSNDNDDSNSNSNSNSDGNGVTATRWPRPVQALRAGSGKLGFGWDYSVDGDGRERDDNHYDSTSAIPRSSFSSAMAQTSSSQQQQQQPQYGYSRFVITFADAAEGRRFARAWHRREMVDERTNRVMIVNTTPLW